MSKTTNAAGSLIPAANEKILSQDYNISPDKKERNIHRSPIKLQQSFPTSLTKLRQWCLAGNNKQPLNPNGYLIDVTNPANYLPFDKAISAASKICAGVGFILTGTNIVIVDIDHCINPDGKVSQIADEVLKLLPTYAEVSQSKTGLHLIYIDNDIPARFTGKKGTIEIYADKRYVALTGWKLPDSPDNLTTLDGLTKRLLDTYFPIVDFNNTPDDDELLKQHSYSPAQSDEQVLQSLQANQKFQQLYTGDISRYPSQSEADGALMLILATATALNAPQMRRLFSQSALGNRDKWVNRKWYQNYLISRAIQFAKVSKETDDVSKQLNKFIFQSDYFTNYYYSESTILRKYAKRNTGFESLNKYQPLPPSLIVIGAEPGTGKTTFCYQLAEQLVQNNDNEFAIYVSYEMSRLELFTKSITRRTKLANLATKSFQEKGDYPLDGFAAQQGKIPNITKHIIDELCQHPLNFGIYEATSTDTIEVLLSNLKQLISTIKTERPGIKNPVVVIDYLQIIPHTKDNHKLGIDNIILKLKEFQRNTKTTFIVISSINRGSYLTKDSQSPTLSAFKESGGIEFTADIAWLLISTKTSKSTSPKQVSLKCLKNRFGINNYTINFDFYAAENLFIETETNSYHKTCAED